MIWHGPDRETTHHVETVFDTESLARDLAELTRLSS
jgi:hypothetical protein